ncbi:NAD-dependent histone deacetylase HST3 [Parachaetomium inaequale]|uniref:NAD-dependent histone deacetylase HST3 n=1 Tax=Parachaetomium inaequale TaxID=2588326 RepID=A0AAN6PA01_9PEZI|nr:NAD-dependent histone deacetylase HST3 [Parachaetomium inaequale]
MPTTHVDPGCDPLLQDIANTLWKARKVVVITGAGISTNSGIPDFRSENGLYSLIQAQFDAAQQQATDNNSDVDASDAIEQRPPKRQRRAHDDAGRHGLEFHEVPFPGLRNAAAKAVPVEGEQDIGVGERQSRDIRSDGPLPTSHPGSEAIGNTSQPRQNTGIEEPANALPDGSLPTSAILPSLRPSRHMHTGIADPCPSSPPSFVLSTPRPRRPHLLDTLPESSSPLSSPPPVMLDPYQESTPGSSSQDTESSRSQSEEPSSATTPLLSSQTSFTSSRNSLPMMKGRDLFDAQIWACPIKTSVFYTFASTLREKVRTAEPTSSHRFVSVLRDSRKLVRCYTQNIDQLEERVGLSTSLSLGAGNRYRFSVRAGRNNGGAKGSTKGAEGAPEASQGSSQKDEDKENMPRAQKDPESAQAAADGVTDGKDGPSPAVQPSQTLSDRNPDDVPTSTPSASQTQAPAAPNRGVECVFLHGSLADLRCFVCARTASWEEETRLADTLAGRQPSCPHCAGATAAREERGKRALGVGKLRPDIVLYGEEHPHAHLISPLVQHDLSLGPDMLLILGTSMRVHGLKVLVKEFAKAVHDRGGKVVFVNFTKPPESVWADIIDFWVQWDCDAWVGDLQARKPALWLPPGAALPEEEKPKTFRLSRRQSGAEPSKRKEGAEKTSKRARESDGFPSSQKEESGLSITVQGPEQGYKDEMAPPALPPPLPKSVPKKAVRVAREPKLNPDAKRPASVRDHKQNGAYLVCKIMEDLRRITGGGLAQSVASSPNPAATRPKGKRPRKSAPAALGLQSTPTQQPSVGEARHVAIRQTHPPALASSPPPNSLSADDATPNRESSISASVKTRKRKQAVTWRMIGGVETRVSLNDAVEPQTPTPSLPNTPAILRPSPVPNSRRLPPPTPTTPQPPPQHHNHPSHEHIPHPQPITTDPSASSAIDVAISAGFRETDRLIAQMHHESRLSRPATPLQLRLPPLLEQVQSPVQKQQQQYQYHTAKLVPMEPKVESPGPSKGISSNVGSPVAVGGNPFFLADPLAGSLRFPPAWLREDYSSSRGREGPSSQVVGLGLRGHLPRGMSPWCPDEQLRKEEQEAAMMLSAMRGTGEFC